jgi:hypothetical protein
MGSPQCATVFVVVLAHAAFVLYDTEFRKVRPQVKRGVKPGLAVSRIGFGLFRKKIFEL